MTTELGPGLELCDGRYRLERRLGAGGMASVWKAEDLRLGRAVAVKVISDSLAAQDAYVVRFEREARIAAGLSHRALVKVFDYDVHEERPLLVMEHVDGGTLSEGLREGGAIDVEMLARELLSALAHIHEAGIVHRDLKPANVLITREGRPLLTDFGIAQAPEATRLTGTGQVIGTLRYLAPEVAAGEPAGPASDLYSLGILLGEAAQGRPVSGELEAAIERLTRRDPRQRPASAEQALALLGPTEPTVPIEGATGASTAATLPIGDDAATTAPTSGGREVHITPAQLLLGLAAVVAVVAALIALSGGSEDGGTALPSPAPSDAPLEQHLDRLDRQVGGLETR